LAAGATDRWRRPVEALSICAGASEFFLAFVPFVSSVVVPV